MRQKSMEISNVVDLKKLIQKLQHNLQEVRRRAFNNLISKLHNGIISIENLLHYQELYTSLLQWLNRHEDDDKVLELFVALTQFPSGCQKVISFGGIDFFTSYQQELSCSDNDRKETVDAILNSLYHHDSDIYNNDEPAIHKNIPSIQEFNNLEEQSKLKCMEIFASYDSVKWTPTTSQKPSCFESEGQANYDNNESGSTLVSRNVSASLAGAPMKQTFQWLPLTSGDRQILAVTESRLQSSSSDLITQSCDFLRNVLLHDFPAEVFIQRPNIVKTLLSVLSVNKNKHTDGIVNILQSLSDMCKKLHQRLLQNQNVDVWQKQLFPEDIQSMSISTNLTQSSSLSSKTNHHQDELDESKQSPGVSSFNNSDVAHIDGTPRDETGVEDMESSIMTEALIQAQLSLQEYLINILLATTDLLKLYLHHNSLFTAVVMLHKRVLSLMILIDMKSLWESDSSFDKTMIYNEMTILSRFSEVSLALTESSNSSLTITEQEIELKSVILCKIVIGFLNSCVPMERLYEVVPDDLSSFLKSVITKVSFMKELPELQKSLEKVLSNLDESYMKIYHDALAMIKSMQKLDPFFALFTQNKTVPDKVIVELSKEISQSLCCHSHEEFIRRLLNICCEKHGKGKDRNSPWKGLFMNVLSSQTLDVKIKAYTVVLDILKDAFSDSLVSHPLSTKHQNAMLVIQKDLLLQVAVDCYHENEQLKNLSASIVCSILTSQLNMSASLASAVVTTMTPLLAILQSNIGISDTAYDSSLFSLLNQPLGIINVDGKLFGLPTVEHARAVLRLMYHKLPKVRSKGFALSLVHLTNYDKENKKVVNYSKENCTHPEDLLVFNGRDLIGFQSLLSHFDSITEENVEKLWTVFKNELMDEGLRHSAADQLSVILQDPSFHKLFLTNSEYKYILERLSFCLHTTSTTMRISTNVIQKKFLSSLIKMLKNLAYHQPIVRHLLSMNVGLYMQLLQIAFLFSKDYEMRFYASSLLCLLLFDEVIAVEEKSNVHLMAPQCVIKNFRLPIDFTATAPIHNKSGEKDNAYCDTIKEFVRNNCWQDMEWYQNDKRHSQCSKHLQLTDVDKEKRGTLNLKNIVTTMMQRCLKPPNHFDAMESLNQLQLVFIVFYELHSSVSSKQMSDAMVELASIFKDGFLRQIVSVFPASEDDHKLFASVIAFINALIQLNYSNVVKDIEDILMSTVITRMIQGTPYDDRSNCVKWGSLLKRLAVTSISSLLHSSKSMEKSPASTDGSKATTITTTATTTAKLSRIGAVIKAIYETLSITGSESYYDLPLMEFMLECLMHLLALQKWSLHVAGGQAFCIELFNWLAQILVSFHVDRVSAAVSFMGKGIVQKTAICLCQLVHEIKLFNDDGEWLKHCTSSSDTSLTSQHSSILPVSPLPWLIPLLSDRLTDIRFCGWAMSTALVCDKVGQRLALNEFQSLPGGLWAAALGVLLDEKECFAVRSQATTLLTKLIQTKKLLPSENEETIWSSIVVQDTSSKMEVNGIHAFLLLLDHFEFFTELRFIFSSSNNNNTTNNTTLINVSTSFSQSSSVNRNGNTTTISSSSGGGTSTKSDSSRPSVGRTAMSKSSSKGLANRNALDLKPPSASPLFKTSLLQLVCKLIELSPDSILKKLDEHQIVDIILSFWLCESTDSTSAPALKRNPNEQTSIHATYSILCLLELLHSKNAGRCSVVVEQYNVVAKLFQLLTTHKTKEISSHQLVLWNQCMSLTGQLYEMEDGKVKATFNQLALNHLPALCDTWEILLNNLKRKDVIQTLSLSLNFLLLILKDIGENNCQDINTIDSIMVHFGDGSGCIKNENRSGERPKDRDNTVDTPVVHYKGTKKGLGKKTSSAIVKHKVNTTEMLNSKDTNGDTKKERNEKSTVSIGERISKFLLTLYGKMYILHEPSLLKDVIRALFVCSVNAKEHALENGFVETVVEELKDKLVKLNMITAFEKDEDKPVKGMLLQELCSIMDLVRNFMVQCEQVKLAFLLSNWIVHLQNVWSWSQLHEGLRICLLEMMTVFAANCNAVCSSLCAVSSLSFKQTLDESSFVNYVIKLLIRLHNEATLVHGKLSPCLRTSFDLLTNILNVSEGRTCFYKANIPQLFQQVHSLTTSGNKNQRHIAKALVCNWLKLYAVISFHSDGVKYISKIQGVTRLLLDIATEAPTNNKKLEYALLIFRSLMFLPASKQMLSSNKEVINLMLEILSGSSLKLKLLAISFFSLMLYDNQKGKGSLNKIGLHKRLLSLQDDIRTGKSLSQDGDLKSHSRLVSMLANTIAHLQN